MFFQVLLDLVLYRPLFGIIVSLHRVPVPFVLLSVPRVEFFFRSGSSTVVQSSSTEYPMTAYILTNVSTEQKSPHLEILTENKKERRPPRKVSFGMDFTLQIEGIYIDTDEAGAYRRSRRF